MNISRKTLQLLAIIGLIAAVSVTGACSGKRSSLMDEQQDTRRVAPMSDDADKAEVCKENPEHPSCSTEELMESDQTEKAM